ncbi:hypothetical protein A1Q1_04839 [Trichosporon asahii var. asahii CBS 2479]|uniref:AB hydrolase-1 domain-containing protein n=1 Tax=Trichosporon asahii var. asahii (strain ATCC 90039 / CBS 2479 / JCM 2466 / KCTC 7840 / NBRC 103889/ NCYC 2677 / UAMH 7654) TaxID=1186058 RepID=J6EQ24_TRIAS|nr:hypothetical protein A1Q1_04839 [Trichosporon asahii var. asahii CBS 2479]EJT46544.1 hypothetical protein A1Q1_04839 [Trichosporon asahii var. asahii CBS 2479]
MPDIVTYPPFHGPSIAPSPCVPPKELLPLLRPPPSTPPPHPLRPEIDPLPASYTRSLHAAPAAWPKHLRESKGEYSRDSTPFGPPAAANEGKEERAKRIVAGKDECIKLREQAKEWDIEEAKAGGHPPQWLAVERWKRNDPHSDGITLVLTHANGLPKEQWHPLLRRAIAASDSGAPGGLFGNGKPVKGSTPIINDIWLLEDTHHGCSADLNAGKLARVVAWADVPRDVLNFVTHVLPSAVNSNSYALDWTDKEAPVKNLVGLGHSLGGNGLVQAAALRPDLFSSLFLVEPMTQPGLGRPMMRKMGDPIPLGALKRRNIWPSPADVKKDAMTKTWDEDVWRLWLSHGIVPVDYSKPDGEVTLATAPWAECAVFSDPVGPQRGWYALPKVRCPVGFIMAGNPTWLGGPDVTKEIPWRAPRGRNERLMDAGHLAIQERPDLVADSFWRFLTTLSAGEWDKTDAKL